MSKASAIKPFVFIISLIVVGCSSSAQDIKIIKFPDLENRIENETAEILVVNFWATFCKPCLEELPLFQELDTQEKVKVILVSMDFASQKALVEGYQSSNKLKTEVVLLDEPDYDSWIPKVDSTWSGALPATLIFNTKTKNKQFKEGIYKKDDLLETIKNI